MNIDFLTIYICKIAIGLVAFLRIVVGKYSIINFLLRILDTFYIFIVQKHLDNKSS